MEISPEENKPMAFVWLTLAIAVGCTGFYVLYTPGRFLAVAFFGLALLLAFFGRQRLSLYKLNSIKFQSTIRNLALFTTFAVVIGKVLSTST